MSYGVIYTNQTTHAVYFLGAYPTMEEARKAIDGEVNAYFCAGPWSARKELRRTLIICKNYDDSEYIHGIYQICPPKRTV